MGLMPGKKKCKTPIPVRHIPKNIRPVAAYKFMVIILMTNKRKFKTILG